MHTYAVLDAAKVQGLPEMLETSGLDHACLFQGAAAEDYGDVAPWIVRLEEGHRLTRGLFTQGDAPWDMWETEPGIFLRSATSLDARRNHLRKFTKVRDENGKWVFLRYWEPRVIALYARILDPTAEEHLAFFLGDATLVAWDVRAGMAWTVSGAPSRRVRGRPVSPTAPWPTLTQDMARVRFTMFQADLGKRLAKRVPPLRDLSSSQRSELVEDMVLECPSRGLPR